MRSYINILEAVNKGCPVATHDIDVNLKNRQKAIDNYYYGPANPDKAGDYWKDAAKRWGIDEKTAQTMKCTNCASFDVSDKMWSCIEDGIKGDDKAEIEAKIAAVSQASTPLAQKMYAEQPQGGEGEQGGDSGQSGDDVVDAEFEEVKDNK